MSVANHPHITLSQQGGFSMLEVLVTVVIAAFGLIGLAGLQISSVNTATKASANTHTLIAIQEISGQLLANEVAAKAGDFNLAASNGGLLAFTAQSDDDVSALNLSEKISYHWLSKLNNTLPGVTAGIDCNSAGLCAISIKLSESVENMEQVISIQL